MGEKKLNFFGDRFFSSRDSVELLCIGFLDVIFFYVLYMSALQGAFFLVSCKYIVVQLTVGHSQLISLFCDPIKLFSFQGKVVY